VDAFFQQQKVIFDAAQQGTGAKDAVYSIFTEASGMNAAQADLCLRTQSFADEVNQQSLKGEEMGVQGTPTIFIQTAKGPTLLAPPYDVESVGRALDAALAALPPKPDAKPAKAKAPIKVKPKAKKP
jgi:protein-disulfide isomerase